MALIVIAVQNGFGQHIADLDPAEAAYGIEMLRLGEFMLIISTVFVKIAICLFLMRLFVRSKAWTTFLWAFIAFNTITSVLDASFIFPQCTPVEYNWNKTIEGRCWSNAAINGIGIMQGSVAAFTDFTLATLPIWFLWEIQIIWRVKIGICAIMALGYASGGFAIARTILVPSLTATHDPTWDLIPLFMWAVLESKFGVIAAAAPSVRPLLGGNVSSTSKSKSKSRQAPLNGASGSAPNSSWLQLGGSSQANAMRDMKKGQATRSKCSRIITTTSSER
ncbi:hypothetical protein LTR74_017899 [Friedmanniomyces endolithicus]|nr:hypothetical protein LTR74_017899 [Friedmanniomyces endolithicus]